MTVAHLEETQFSMTRGDAVSFRVTVEDADGAPVDITGAVVLFQARKHAHSTEVAIEKETPPSEGIEIEDGPGGVCRIDILPADTEALGNWRQEFLFDVQVTKDGLPTTVARGTLTIEPDIAR